MVLFEEKWMRYDNVKWNNSDTESYILHGFSYIRHKKQLKLKFEGNTKTKFLFGEEDQRQERQWWEREKGSKAIKKGHIHVPFCKMNITVLHRKYALIKEKNPSILYYYRKNDDLQYCKNQQNSISERKWRLQSKVPNFALWRAFQGLQLKKGSI